MRVLTQSERGLGAQEFRTSRLGGCPGPGLELEGNTNSIPSCVRTSTPVASSSPRYLRTDRVPTDLRQWLIKEFNLDGAGGEFSKMFPQLDKVTRVFQTLDTNTIDQILSGTRSSR